MKLRSSYRLQKPCSAALIITDHRRTAQNSRCVAIESVRHDETKLRLRRETIAIHLFEDAKHPFKATEISVDIQWNL
jgi:hypothetical protein